MLFTQVESSDLIAYGLIPEFVGRFPILVSLLALSEEQLVQVLTEPKNALGRQYKKLFSMNNVSVHAIYSSFMFHLESCLAHTGVLQVKLHFTDTALRLVAKKAMAKNTGARGLRALLENILIEAMFEVCLLYLNC